MDEAQSRPFSLLFLAVLSWHVLGAAIQLNVNKRAHCRLRLERTIEVGCSTPTVPAWLSSNCLTFTTACPHSSGVRAVLECGCTC